MTVTITLEPGGRARLSLPAPDKAVEHLTIQDAVRGDHLTLDGWSKTSRFLPVTGSIADNQLVVPLEPALVAHLKAGRTYIIEEAWAGVREAFEWPKPAVAFPEPVVPPFAVAPRAPSGKPLPRRRSRGLLAWAAAAAAASIVGLAGLWVYYQPAWSLAATPAAGGTAANSLPTPTPAPKPRGTATVADADVAARRQIAALTLERDELRRLAADQRVELDGLKHLRTVPRSAAPPAPALVVTAPAGAGWPDLREDLARARRERDALQGDLNRAQLAWRQEKAMLEAALAAERGRIPPLPVETPQVARPRPWPETMLVTETEPAGEMEPPGVWGAAALAGNGDIQTSRGHATRAAAAAAAVQACQAAGGFECEVIENFQNACFAVARPRRKSGDAFARGQALGSSQQRARRAALQVCAADYGEQCNVTLVDCSPGTNG